jgi:hypothetical protein
VLELQFRAAAKRWFFGTALTGFGKPAHLTRNRLDAVGEAQFLADLFTR